jgi:hypothetical protein
MASGSALSLEAVAAGFRAGAPTYRGMGSPLYGVLCEAIAGDPELVALAACGQMGRPMHLLSAVHHLLLRDPTDPLARFFATLSPTPESPEHAFPEFARFCRLRRGEILDLLETRIIQTTFVERCWAVLPALSQVAEAAGEPLNLIEIGCSAGVLLTFDRYAYDFGEAGRIGPEDAPLVIRGELSGRRPPQRLPRIGARIGLDLNPIDARSEDERRWLLALCFPEVREQQARLATALDLAARSDIGLFAGDALETLPLALAGAPDPVCVFHSQCVFYWSAEGRAALDRLLLEASRTRVIHRVGLEPSERFDGWRTGRADTPEAVRVAKTPVEIVITRYARGEAESRLVARATPDYGFVDWVG